MRVRSLFALLPLPVVLLLLVASPAAADTIRLRSGKALDIDTLQIQERAVHVTMQRDGGIVEAMLPFTRLDAIAFLKAPYAKLLTPLQRKRVELLAYLQHLLAERDKARKEKEQAAAKAPPAPKPAPAPRPVPPPRPPPEADDPPTEGPPGGVPSPRTGAGGRFRDRRPWSRDPPNVPGTERPGRSGGGSSRGGSGGGGKSGGGGGSSGGGGTGGGLGGK